VSGTSDDTATIEMMTAFGEEDLVLSPPVLHGFLQLYMVSLVKIHRIFLYTQYVTQYTVSSRVYTLLWSRVLVYPCVSDERPNDVAYSTQHLNQCIGTWCHT
jgi:hypothetical protein